MNTLRANELKNMRQDENQDLLLINVLDDEAFEKEHIPGSHHIDQDRDDFVNQVRSLASEKTDRTIVVYCASKDCPASPTAAKKLEKAGFTDVHDFEGGMAEWKMADFKVESGSPSSVQS